MHRLKFISITFIFIMFAFSCTPEAVMPDWPWHEEEEPAPEPEPEPEPDPQPGQKGKNRYVWISCEGN